MPGAWEVTDTAICCILHTEAVTLPWAMALRALQVPGEVIPLSGMPFDHARNAAAMACLEKGADWCFFLDSDVTPPADVIFRLMAHREPIVSGIYYRRSPPVGLPVMIKDGKHVTNFPANSLIDVDLVGAGCLLIHRSVLETLPAQEPGKHWFNWKVDREGLLPRGECMSEDYTFCKHAAQVGGYKVKVDTSVICGHLGLANATKEGMAPLDGFVPVN